MLETLAVWEKVQDARFWILAIPISLILTPIIVAVFERFDW